MTAASKAILEAILPHDPLATVRLRREARLSAEGAKSRFDRALVELRVAMKVIAVGVVEAGAWDYAFTYEILQRHYPELPEKARAIRRSEARRTLVIRHLEYVAAADGELIAKVFHVLKWMPAVLQRTLHSPLDDDAISGIHIT